MIVIAVQFEKTGVVNASGEGVNPNLAHNTYGLQPWATSQVEFKVYRVGLLDVSAGETITISFDLDMDVQTPAIYLLVYNTNYKGPHTIDGVNALLGRTIPVGKFHERLSVTTTVRIRESPTETEWDYIEFYSNYDTENAITISNIKVERGSVATPWCPHVDDPEYTGSSLGFTESDEKPSIGKAGYVQATEFIEW